MKGKLDGLIINKRYITQYKEDAEADACLDSNKTSASSKSENYINK